MSNEDLVYRLVKLRHLWVCEVERNSDLVCKTYRDLDIIFMNRHLCTTYGKAIENLIEWMNKIYPNSIFKEEALSLREDILNSPIRDLRFGLEPQRRYTKDESELDNYLLRCTLFLHCAMKEIKIVAEQLGLTVGQIKQACQQERLLNTKKVGATWEVNIHECRKYWNIAEDQTSPGYFREY